VHRVHTPLDQNRALVHGGPSCSHSGAAHQLCARDELGAGWRSWAGSGGERRRGVEFDDGEFWAGTRGASGASTLGRGRGRAVSAPFIARAVRRREVTGEEKWWPVVEAFKASVSQRGKEMGREVVVRSAVMGEERETTQLLAQRKAAAGGGGFDRLELGDAREWAEWAKRAGLASWLGRQVAKEGSGLGQSKEN
jgi:hypothetical protein